MSDFTHGLLVGILGTLAVSAVINVVFMYALGIIGNNGVPDDREIPNPPPPQPNQHAPRRLR